jgi:hypothetical protein
MRVATLPPVILAIVSTTNIQNTNASDQAGGILMFPNVKGARWDENHP